MVRKSPFRAFPAYALLGCAFIALFFCPPVVASFGAPNDTGAYTLGEWSKRGKFRSGGLRLSREAHGKHYFLGTSAIPQAPNTGYYKNTLVTLNSASYGLTRHLGVGAGLDVFSIITTRGADPNWYARMQFGGSVSSLLHLGVQAMYMALPPPRRTEPSATASLPSGFGTLMGLATVGNEAYQFTLGAAYLNDGTQAARGPLLQVAGMMRVAPNLAVVMEHWIFTDPDNSYPMYSAGVRILGDHLALDIGLAYDRERSATITPIGLPFLSGTLNF